MYIEKLVLFLLQRGIKEHHLTCGGLFVASFECFATVKSKRRRGGVKTENGNGSVRRREREREIMEYKNFYVM